MLDLWFSITSSTVSRFMIDGLVSCENTFYSGQWTQAWRKLSVTAGISNIPVELIMTSLLLYLSDIYFSSVVANCYRWYFTVLYLDCCPPTLPPQKAHPEELLFGVKCQVYKNVVCTKTKKKKKKLKAVGIKTSLGKSQLHLFWTLSFAFVILFYESHYI